MTYENKTCCFFGHRKINETAELKNNLNRVIENLIINEKADTFLFGSKSEFNELCLNVVTQLRGKYPYIKRVYVRAEFPYIDEDYKNYLLKSYEEIYYPKKMVNAGKAAYVERNREMIDSSDFCVVYYDESYTPKRKNSKSGTKEKHLNIRAFTDTMKRKVYEKQKGICPHCKAEKKEKIYWELEEMEADHITPWCEGGKTEIDNCQMLCRNHNRRKSGK